MKVKNMKHWKGFVRHCMGGTGKSQVIKALKRFFEKMNESHRFVILGPTGTSAALLGGSTYHSFLGVHMSDG
jgi:hypothetical protein